MKPNLAFYPIFELTASSFLQDGVPLWVSDTCCFLSNNDYKKAEAAIEADDKETLFRLLLRLDEHGG